MCSSGNNTKVQLALTEQTKFSDLFPYPVDMARYDLLLRTLPVPESIPVVESGQMSGNITRDALICGNDYFVDNNERHLKMFISHARWLVDQEQYTGDDASGWPVTIPFNTDSAGKRCLSALVQGQAVSVLVRAYALTGEAIYLDVARRAYHTFERDILDGGISTPVTGNGVYFEEYAVYPAAHMLPGMVFAMLGLADYLKLGEDTNGATLLRRSHESLHRLLPELDAGYWTRSDLLRRHLTSTPQHELQTSLLQTLSLCLHCDECAALASRWKGYGQRKLTRLHSQAVRRGVAIAKKSWRPLQNILFKRKTSVKKQEGGRLRVYVPITAFPVTGGMRTVIASIAHVTRDIWHMEYLTPFAGPNPEKLPIHCFGLPARVSWLMAPWQFPSVWLYMLAGAKKLISLLRHSREYALILPQDGVYTAAFAALIARLAGIRVVCMDYGNLTLLHNLAYRRERLEALATKKPLERAFGPLLFMCYWPSLAFFAWLSTRLVDHFLIAGVEGDGIEAVYCDKLGVPRSRVTRYAYMIDLDRHPVYNAAERARKREQCDIPVDALVITMICRFGPEKGVDIALASISQVLTGVSPEQRARVRFVLAGNGPLKEQIEAEINARGLYGVCKMWGEASPEDVVTLLGVCDIFLHTSTRGAYYSVTMLEAMASGCAIVASNQPPLNTQLLADGRGIIVPVGDAAKTAEALVCLLTDLRQGREMGERAREYIAVWHSPETLKRVLVRASCWSELDRVLQLNRDIKMKMGEKAHWNL